MPDTVRTDAQILALFADNTSGDIGAQDLRDGYVTLRARDAVLEAALTQTLTPRIAASSDDALENSSTGVVTLNALTLSFNDVNINGVRFLVPEIPQGARIVSANIAFTPNVTGSGAAVIDIWGFAADAVGTFTADANSISSLPLTDAQVQWSIPINSWPAGTPQTTPDLTQIVQEIVDRAGFDGVLAFRVQKVVSSGSNRAAISYDDTPGSSPKLTVQFIGVPVASEGGGGEEPAAASTYVSVVDFGAEPSTPESGIVDAAAGIQAAIDFVANAALSPTSQKVGGTVFIPEGVWYISVPIKMKTRVGVLGASRTGTVIRKHTDFVGSAFFILNNNLVNFTDIRNMQLQGSSTPSGLGGIDYQNANDVNSDTIFDIGDPFHIFADLDIFGFSSNASGFAIKVHSRATLMHNINIHRCGKGIQLQGSDQKVMNCDISWLNEEGVIITGGNNKLVNVKCWFIGANPPGTSTGDATYTAGDAFVLQSSGNTLVGCEAQDVSRHGLRIVNGDQNRVDIVLDNIGNFRLMQGQGVQHPTTTAKVGVKLESPSNGANYNRLSITLKQRSINPDLQGVVEFGPLCSDNYIDIMHNPAQKSTGAPVINAIRGDAINNVVTLNGKPQGIVVSSVDDGLDDGQETISSTVVNGTSTDAGIRSDRLHLVRFLVPDLPQGVRIKDARIQFSAGSSNSAAMDITFWCEDADEAATITVANGNISGRNKTDASVVWADVPEWSSASDVRRSYHQLTPSLADIVQEVVDRAGFDGVLAFIFQGSDATAFRNFATFENTSATEPTLTVVYE